jgi:glycosyltransferase involved in cell wall biosynthesis
VRTNDAGFYFWHAEDQRPMNILIVHNSKLPVQKYGGTERVILFLGKALKALHHKVYYLLPKSSSCPFADGVLEYNEALDINHQIPDYIDVVHLNILPPVLPKRPYVFTLHGNRNEPCQLPANTIFISADHARRYHATQFVYNGFDWDEYTMPDWSQQRTYFHFLGHAGWKVKNLKGAIRITRKAGEKLVVLGGHRLNLNMGIKFFPQLHVSFKGMVNGRQKNHYLGHSKGLLFPVLWNEPFGLAIIESLYMGCPVFGTPYGSLPELVKPGTGYLANTATALAAALQEANSFNRRYCHEYAGDCFNAQVMARNYLRLYEQVLNGRPVQTGMPYLEAADIPPGMLPFEN